MLQRISTSRSALWHAVTSGNSFCAKRTAEINQQTLYFRNHKGQVSSPFCLAVGDESKKFTNRHHLTIVQRSNIVY